MWEVKTKYTVGDARPNWVRGMMPCQHRYVDLPDGIRVNSMVDGMDFSRRIGDLMVRLGDVHSDQNAGTVAIGTVPRGETGATVLKKRRMYA